MPSRCKKCNADLVERDSVCDSCGYPAGTDDLVKKIQLLFASILSDPPSYCLHCAVKLDEESQVSTVCVECGKSQLLKPQHCLTRQNNHVEDSSDNTINSRSKSMKMDYPDMLDDDSDKTNRILRKEKGMFRIKAPEEEEISFKGDGSDTRSIFYIEGEERLILENIANKAVDVFRVEIVDGGDLIRFQEEKKWPEKYLSGDMVKIRVEDGLTVEFENPESESESSSCLILYPDKSEELCIELNTTNTKMLEEIHPFNLKIHYVIRGEKESSGMKSTFVHGGYVTGPKSLKIDFDLAEEQCVTYPGGEIEVPLEIRTNYSCTIDPARFEVIDKKERIRVDYSRAERLSIQPARGRGKRKKVLKLPVKSIVRTSGGIMRCSVKFAHHYSKPRRESNIHIIQFV
ncbi:MAG: hypothetical protein ACFFD4_33255 [Candidatus Odinarchaeota archaeon]